MKSTSVYKERGSAHIIIPAVLVLVIVGLLGFIFWQNFINKDPAAKNDSTLTTEKDSNKNESSPEPKSIKEGSIGGSLTYPSEGIPDDLVVYALNLDTNKEYFTKDHIKDSQYQYGVGYKISVPEGKYYVYGKLDSNPKSKAYYNEFVKCGMSVACKDYSKIVVNVEAGKEVMNVTVGDWYNNQ